MIKKILLGMVVMGGILFFIGNHVSPTDEVEDSNINTVSVNVEEPKGSRNTKDFDVDNHLKEKSEYLYDAMKLGPVKNPTSEDLINRILETEINGDTIKNKVESVMPDAEYSITEAIGSEYTMYATGHINNSLVALRFHSDTRYVFISDSDIDNDPCYVIDCAYLREYIFE